MLLTFESLLSPAPSVLVGCRMSAASNNRLTCTADHLPPRAEGTACTAPYDDHGSGCPIAVVL
jgi:hypothetical protein